MLAQAEDLSVPLLERAKFSRSSARTSFEFFQELDRPELKDEVWAPVTQPLLAATG